MKIPEGFLNYHSNYLTTRLVLGDDGNIRPDGRQPQFNIFARMWDCLTRSSQQVQANKDVARKFVDGLRKEYGPKVAKMASRELSAQLEKGRPLTAYRVHRTLVKATRMEKSLAGSHTVQQGKAKPPPKPNVGTEQVKPLSRTPDQPKPQKVVGRMPEETRSPSVGSDDDELVFRDDRGREMSYFGKDPNQVKRQSEEDDELLFRDERGGVAKHLFRHSTDFSPELYAQNVVRMAKQGPQESL